MASASRVFFSLLLVKPASASGLAFTVQLRAVEDLQLQPFNHVIADLILELLDNLLISHAPSELGRVAARSLECRKG